MVHTYICVFILINTTKVIAIFKPYFKNLGIINIVSINLTNCSTILDIVCGAPNARKGISAIETPDGGIYLAADKKT